MFSDDVVHTFFEVFRAAQGVFDDENYVDHLDMATSSGRKRMAPHNISYPALLQWTNSFSICVNKESEENEAAVFIGMYSEAAEAAGADVSRAVEVDSQWPLAVKRYGVPANGDSADSLARRKRAMREIELLKLVDHPHIVAMLGYCLPHLSAQLRTPRHKPPGVSL